MTKWNTAIVLFAVAVALLTTPRSASACSCAEVPSPATAFERATAVFSGLVVSLEGPTGPVISSVDPVTVQFVVYTVWKGPKQHELLVTTAVSSASCGFDFRIGCTYLVYAREPEDALQFSLCGGPQDALQVNMCGGTKLFIVADDDLDFLGDGQAVVGGPDEGPFAAGDENTEPCSEDGGFNYVALITLVSGIIIGIGIAAAARWRHVLKG